MIPLYGHRYLPCGHSTYGHPVLSMWGTDIVYYGTDLVDYLHREFGGPGIDGTHPNRQPHATVAFWLWPPAVVAKLQRQLDLIPVRLQGLLPEGSEFHQGTTPLSSNS